MSRDPLPRHYVIVLAADVPAIEAAGVLTPATYGDPFDGGCYHPIPGTDRAIAKVARPGVVGSTVTVAPGVTVYRRAWPAAVEARRIGPGDGPIRASLILEVATIAALTVPEIQTIAADEGVDLTGMTTRREAAIAIVRARRGGDSDPYAWAAGITEAVLDQWIASHTPAEIVEAAARKGIDVTGAASKAEAQEIIARAIGLIP